VSFLNWQPRVCEYKCWRKCLNWEESPSLNKFIASKFVSCFIQQLALIQCLFSLVFSGYILPKTWFINLHNIKIRFPSCSWVKDINKPFVWFFYFKEARAPLTGLCVFFPLGYEMFWSGPICFPCIRLMWVLVNGLTLSYYGIRSE